MGSASFGERLAWRRGECLLNDRIPGPPLSLGAYLTLLGLCFLPCRMRLTIPACWGCFEFHSQHHEVLNIRIGSVNLRFIMKVISKGHYLKVM